MQTPTEILQSTIIEQITSQQKSYNYKFVSFDQGVVYTEELMKQNGSLIGRESMVNVSIHVERDHHKLTWHVRIQRRIYVHFQRDCQRSARHAQWNSEIVSMIDAILAFGPIYRRQYSARDSFITLWISNFKRVDSTQRIIFSSGKTYLQFVLKTKMRNTLVQQTSYFQRYCGHKIYGDRNTEPQQ